jgi:hypothetical protein
MRSNTHSLVALNLWLVIVTSEGTRGHVVMRGGWPRVVPTPPS